LIAADSKGSFFAKRIKGKFKFRQVQIAHREGSTAYLAEQRGGTSLPSQAGGDGR
jgi:hypothetical protein